ncbi:MAG: helix-turn-helix transcriptional regulator [Clostridia bacterium]|nr:helix-turn-helix transcriptional regulator [Clostridia bacterium]
MIEQEKPSNQIFQRIDLLMKINGKKQKELTDYLGLDRTAYTSWKKALNNSYLSHMLQICTFLNTTPNYLFLGEEVNFITPAYDPQNLETTLLHTFRNLDESKQRELVKIALVMSSD